MNTTLDNLIDINTSGLVLMACNAHNVRDLDAINLYKQWVKKQVIDQMEQDDVGVEGLSKVMDEKLALLNQKLEHGEDLSIQEDEVEKEDQQPDLSIQEDEVEKEDQQPKKQKVNSGYKPQSTDMPTKLANERKPTTKIILEDCVQLGLLARKRAEYLVTQMAGKQPMEAEKEIVKELRENLHMQVRKFIRKDKKGPWSAPKAQEELRVEIVQTPTVRSMVYLTREILRERDEWKDRSRNSITGRIFGSRMTVDKNK